MTTPRGIRNNNPGNIRKGADAWQGLAPLERQLDASFCVFELPEYGIRALAITLRTYQTKYGLDTIAKIINRWAPPAENDTSAYALAVAKAAGVSVIAPYSLVSVDHMRAVVTAIIQHENGQQPYSLDVILRGLQLAGIQ